MGNKPAGQKIKAFFSDAGSKIESGFKSVYDQVIVPVYNKVAPVVEKVGERVLNTGGKLLDLADHTIDKAKDTEDSFSKILDNLSKPLFLYPAIIVGGLIVYKLVDGKK
jgi:hypothetical protein